MGKSPDQRQTWTNENLAKVLKNSTKSAIELSTVGPI